jgi:hypothetical protein
VICEYALDPMAVLLWKDRPTQKLIREAFRFGSGRVPACLPSKWLAQVLSAYDDADQNEKKRFVEFARGLDLRKSSRQSSVWDGAKRSWLQNILMEHAARPFHAIVTPQSAAGCQQITTADVDLDNTIWRVQRTKRIERNGEVLASALAPMLYASRTVIIFDPVFRLIRYSGQYSASTSRSKAYYKLVPIKGSRPKCEY